MEILDTLGQDGFTTALVIVVILAQLIGRLIPDDATGILGVIRKVAKVVGLYVANRVTADKDTDAAAREAIR